jgi:protein SCO1/2
MTARTSQIVLIFSAFLTGLVIFAGVFLYATGNFGGGGPAASAIGGPFKLVDQNGDPITDADLKGKPHLVFFGYTHCPDICPTTLFDVSEVLRALGKDADGTGALFITVDPERDTAEHLADYVSAFHRSLVGLTGAPDEIRKVATAYKAYYAKVESADRKDYVVDHTAFIYLVGKDGQYLGFLPPSTTPERLGEVIRQQLSR